MKEQISALMDDELSTDGLDHLFTAVKSDDKLGECWTTYHLIGDVMRGNPLMKPDFKERLMQKLEAEPAVLAPRNITRERRPMVWSVAASAAAVLFVGWVVLQQQAPENSNTSGVEIAQAQPATQGHNIPSEYLQAHQAVAPSSSSYFVQPAAYSENVE
ncbi:MAG TPA: sigma-E factor negative regulatory protein [Methylophilaceae bacterium]|nr:sigma-E factor negative regulatory protein [Methylophilaceae bacterium]